MRATVQRQEERNKALITSIVIHAILLALLFLLHVNIEAPPVEAPPILIDFGGGGGDNAAAGLPDEGQGDSPAPQGQQMDDPSVTEPVEDPSSEPSPPVKSTPPPPSSAKPTPQKSTSTTPDPNVAALRKAQEETQRRQQEQARIRKAQEDAARAAELERQRQAQAEADRIRQAQEERDKKKGQFGSTFGKPGASGTGQGNTGNPGNQGSPTGTGDNPFGKTNGSGTGSGGGDGSGVGESIGGGLGGRKVIGRPSMVDNTQKTGKVAVRVCVDGDGRVTSAGYTQLGSTTTDSVLRNKAESWARQYRFAASNAPEQCGTITFDFRVK